MENFNFYSPTKLIMQPNAEVVVGNEVIKYSKKVLFVHYGDDFFIRSGLYDKIMNSLKTAGLEIYEAAGIVPNPILEPVYRGIELCKAHGIGFILAVGGGSVIDTAKAIALGAKYDGDVWDLYIGKGFVAEALPVGAVMTIAATGSEGSNGSVITNEKTNEKRDVMGDMIRPVFAIMNPEITFSLPIYQTACGIVDMLSHTMERYFSTSQNVELTDRLGEGLMTAIMNSGKMVMKEPNNYDARADLMLASILSHNGLTGIGRNQDWACHMMGAQISGHYNAVHGATLSILIPAWAAYVYKDNPDRFAQFAERVMGINVEGLSKEEAALQGIEKLKDFYRELGMPLTLKEIGIEDDSKFEAMAIAATLIFGPIGCMKALTAADVTAIYKSVL